MHKKTSFTYTIDNHNNKVIKEVQYNDYSKNADNEETVLMYKNIIKDNGILETFNKLCRFDDNIDEIVGNSKNKRPWKIRHYKNSIFEKQYREPYNKLHFDINYDMIDKLDDKQNLYIKDKMD